MTTVRRLAWSMACLIAWSASMAHAQTGGLFGSSGVNGRSGTSSSGLGGQQAFGTQATGFTGTNISSMSGFTSGGLGTQGYVGRSNTGFTGNRTASNSTTGGTGQAGQLGGSQFGGSQFGTSRMGGSQFGQFGSTNFGSFGRNQNFGAMQMGQNVMGLGGASESKPLRPQARIAFPYARRSADVVRSSVAVQISGLQDRRFENLDVQLDQAGVLTLRGAAANDDDRRLAAALARLEPGVRKVVNEMTVVDEAR